MNFDFRFIIFMRTDLSLFLFCSMMICASLFPQMLQIPYSVAFAENVRNSVVSLSCRLDLELVVLSYVYFSFENFAA